MKFAFASVVTTKKITKDEKFSRLNIWVKRPGTGDYPAEKYNYLLGKKSLVNIPINIPMNIPLNIPINFPINSL